MKTIKTEPRLGPPVTTSRLWRAVWTSWNFSNVSGTATAITVNRLKKIIVPAIVRTAAQISWALGCPKTEIPGVWKTFLS